MKLNNKTTTKMKKFTYITSIHIIIFIIHIMVIILTNCDALLVEANQRRQQQHQTSEPQNHQHFLMDTQNLYEDTSHLELFRNIRSHGSSRVTSKQQQRRLKRSTSSSNNNSNNLNNQNKFIDACQSKMEVLTPYYATNSKGQLRTIVNSELMQQAIQVETCLMGGRGMRQQSNKCNSQPDCGCEQKYKWHRLLVMDSSASNHHHQQQHKGGANNRGGLFMDWFLFPSNCVCRCRNPSTVSKNNFLKTITATTQQQQQQQTSAQRTGG